MKKLREAAQIFADFGATEVYLFGSYAEGRATVHSDADFAVLGRRDDKFFEAMGQAMFALGRTLDLVRLESDTPFVRCLKELGPLVRLI